MMAKNLRKWDKMKAILKSGICWLVCCICLASCAATAEIPQPTLEELLAEVNAEHQAVTKTQIDDSVYLRQTVDDQTRYAYYTAAETEYDPARQLTQQQAQEDVEYLFGAFYNCYSLYDYFGGEEAFDAAEAAILQEIGERETLTGEELQDILLSHLDFLKDGHFSVNYQTVALLKIPFFFREETFVKTADGYETLSGKKVDSVEGYPDLDDLFKRSISPEGYLVYYPVLLKDCTLWGAWETPQSCDETLLVHYTDGTTAELTAEPYQLYTELDREHPEELQVVLPVRGEDIPVFQFNGFSRQYEEEILNGADALKDAPIGILDLRSNSGGYGELPYNWMWRYAGTRVYPHRYFFNVFRGTRLYDGVERWVSHENTLVILTGKYSGSSSEVLVDIAYNLENTLLIGENTAGGLLGTSNKIALPNSGCAVNVGGETILLPAEVDYFEELRGFYPDIWVPAGEAEELAVKLLQNIRTNR